LTIQEGCGDEAAAVAAQAEVVGDVAATGGCDERALGERIERAVQADAPAAAFDPVYGEARNGSARGIQRGDEGGVAFAFERLALEGARGDGKGPGDRAAGEVDPSAGSDRDGGGEVALGAEVVE